MKIHRLSLSTCLFLFFGTSFANAQSFTDVTIGTSHICAVADTAEVECTTASHAQRYGAPEDLTQMIDITAGDQHTCGIDLDGQAVCWADNQSEFGAFDQASVPAITQPLVSIEAGTNHTCAVDVDGRVWCWGLDTNQQSQPPGDGLGANGAGFIKVDGGLNFSCGIQTGGDIVCWTNDSHLLSTSNIAGPFTDLDISYRTACGLRSNGTIDCWRSQFEPPNNGPYTDLVVSRFAICGLNQNQVVDCTFRSGFEPDEPVFPADARFTAIESGSEVFSASLPFCGLTVSGTIECSSSTQFDALNPPGSEDSTDQSLDNVRFALTAQFYARNRLELFWNSPPARYGNERILVEVYRNDVLVDTTENSNSWYDATTQDQSPVDYKIRAIDRQGRIGPFSSTVTVDNETGVVTINDQRNKFDIVTPAHTVDSLSVSFSGNTHYVIWTGSEPGMDALKGYEVRINNAPVVFSDGFIHRLESFDRSDCNIISVAAMSEDGTMFDYRSIVINRFSRNYSSCTDR